MCSQKTDNSRKSFRKSFFITMVGLAFRVLPAVSLALVGLLMVATAMVLTSCGEAPTFTTRQNFQIYADGHPISQENVEMVADAVVQQLIARRPNVYSDAAIEGLWAVSSVDIYLTDHPIACPTYGEAAVCRGLYSDGSRIDLVYDACVGNTSLAHEILHLLRDHFEGDADASHNDTDLFHAANSVEQVVRSQARGSACQSSSSSIR